MRPRGRRFAFAAVVTVALAATPAAVAASSVESGWWTSAPVALAPDVAADQLLVQGGADASQPTAYAGISFELQDGETPTTLVLAVAPNSGTTPGAGLSLCRLSSPATPAKGDPASSGPSFDCASKVAGKASADGASYEFDVGELVAGSSLDVAVLPAQPTDRVVLRKPAVDALRSGGASSSAAAASTSDVADGTSTGAGATDTGGGPFGADVSFGPADAVARAPGNDASFDLPAAPAPPLPSPAASDAAATPRPSPSIPVVAQQAVAAHGSHSLAPFVFVGLALVAAAMWTLAGHRSPDAAVE